MLLPEILFMNAPSSPPRASCGTRYLPRPRACRGGQASAALVRAREKFRANGACSTCLSPHKLRRDAHESAESREQRTE
eukprot:1532455-Rhodomonas_salina.1